MGNSLEQEDSDFEKECDEIILDEISRRMFSGDIKDNDYSSKTGLTSLEYFLLRNFEISTWKEVSDLKKKVYGRVMNLNGGSNMSEFESRPF